MCLREKIGPDPRNFNQRVSLGRNDLFIRTFPSYSKSAQKFWRKICFADNPLCVAVPISRPMDSHPLRDGEMNWQSASNKVQVVFQGETSGIGKEKFLLLPSGVAEQSPFWRQ